MKLHPEDPRLTAFVLGELGPEEAAAVEKAAAADPALLAEIAGMRDIQRILTNHLALPGQALQPRQRDNVRRSAREADRAGKIISLRTLKAWLIPAAAAAVLALATFILIRPPDSKPAVVAAQSSLPTEFPVAPPPLEPVPEKILTSPPVPYGSVAAASLKLELPVLTTSSNLQAVSDSIRVGEKLPAPNSIRPEEILNSFPLRLNGTTSIARSAANKWHPDTRDGGVSTHVATLSTEMIACPWKPSATLLLVSLRGNARNDCDVKFTFHPNPENVVRYRLLGFPPVPAQPSGKLPSILAANSTTTLAIEIESSKPGGDLGSLAWSTNGETAPAISLVHQSAVEPSDDARFGALVCTYAQWLAGEQAGIIEAEIVLALAREVASANLPADRADFLNLIDRSLNL